MTRHNPSAGDSRLERGKRALAEIDGEAGHKVVAALADIAPDFATYLFEFPFGDIYSRPGLGLRDREIATIAALASKIVLVIIAKPPDGWLIPLREHQMYIQVNKNLR